MRAEPPVIALLRSREDLQKRIEERCRRMLREGLVEELRRLLAEGLSPDAPGLRTVGYHEFLPHLISGRPVQACAERFFITSRQYAKRQETWLRHRLPNRVEVSLSAGEEPAVTVERIHRLGLFAAGRMGQNRS